MRGVVAPVLHEYGVTFQVFHGYISATVVQQAAEDSLDGDKLLVVFYIGDYDPSGLHMSEVDLPQRLERYGGVVDLVRLALTEQDIGPNLPSFPLASKTSDPQWRWYWDRTGLNHCWELDALSPVVLRERLEQTILAEIEPEAWERVKLCEQAEQESLATVLGQWQKLTAPTSVLGQAHE